MSIYSTNPVVIGLNQFWQSFVLFCERAPAVKLTILIFRRIYSTNTDSFVITVTFDLCGLLSFVSHS